MNLMTQTSPQTTPAVFFKLIEIQRYSPRELRLRTGKIILALCAQPEGLTREELTLHLNPCYATVSLQYKCSLIEATAKLIQRARKRFQLHGINLIYDKQVGKFKAIRL